MTEIRNTAADMPLTSAQLARFQSKVGAPKPSTGCEEWKGSRLRGTHQYGMFRINGRIEYAHRISFRINHGPIPEGKRVLHRCDNPPCTRGDHLFAGTAGDNSRDMRDKGRGRNKTFPGSTNAIAKLDESDVCMIRALYTDGARQTMLATRFGVSQALISLIARREAWRHVPPLNKTEHAAYVAIAQKYAADTGQATSDD